MNDQGAAIGLGDAKGDAEFISDKVKTFMDPVPEFELKYIQPEEGVYLLELRVHQGNMPPYYFVNSGSRIAFVRIGDESVIATSHQLSSLVLKGRNVTYDSLPTEFRREDVSFHKLGESYEKQIDAPLLEKLLHSFSLITTSGMLTNAGVLFSDQCHYRHSSLYCTRWSDIHKDVAKDSREYQGNLLSLLEAGVQFVDLHNMKGWIKLPNTRINTADYSSRAVFEALVNALIHRDYSELGSEVHIDIYDDRLVIYSPGGMFDGTLIQEHNLDEVSSKRRNPILADVFAQLNFMEKRGSGLRKICNETAKLPGFTKDKEPRFRSQAGSFYAEILNSNYKIAINDPVNDPVKTLTQLQKELLALVKDKPAVTRSELCEELKISLATVRRTIAVLKDLNLIERVGSDKTGYWLVNEKLY